MSYIRRVGITVKKSYNMLSYEKLILVVRSTNDKKYKYYYLKVFFFQSDFL